MAKLVLHRRTSEQLAAYTASPSHAVLLVGPDGIGKSAVARQLIAEALAIDEDKLTNYAYLLTIEPTGASISIEAVRELQRFLQLKTLGSAHPIRRAVLIEHADTLTVEAQNAFLKILEEPPADTILVLTAHNQRSLLATILSRVQLITLHTPNEEAVKTFFAEHGDRVAQNYLLSGGLPGLLTALLNEDSAHPLTEGVAQAKLILQKQLFERLALVESLSKQKEQAGYVLEALQHIAQTCIAQATAKQDLAKLKQWHHIRKVAHQAQQALAVSANTKLTLTNFMLSL